MSKLEKEKRRYRKYMGFLLVFVVVMNVLAYLVMFSSNPLKEVYFAMICLIYLLVSVITFLKYKRGAPKI